MVAYLFDSPLRSRHCAAAGYMWDAKCITFQKFKFSEILHFGFSKSENSLFYGGGRSSHCVDLAGRRADLSGNLEFLISTASSDFKASDFKNCPIFSCSPKIRCLDVFGGARVPARGPRIFRAW